MKFFKKALADLSYDDIVLFCEERHKESSILDYKTEFPRDLAKTVSSFANTFGGSIIIGVDEKDGLPIPPFKGIPYSTNLEERVLNTCVDSIFPPIVPEIKVCHSNDSTLSFVVISVAESDLTPHAIESNTKAYVRTGNISKPEDLISFDRIEWLIHKRQKSVDFRDTLQESAFTHLRNLCKYRKGNLSHGLLSIFICPLYPREPLFPTPNLQGLIESSRTKSGNGWHFPERENFRSIKDGTYSYLFVDRSLFTSYFEMTRFGSIYFQVTLCSANLADPQSPPMHLRFSQIVDYLNLSLEFAEKAFSSATYWGNLYFSVKLDKLLGTTFYHSSDSFPDNPYQLDDSLAFERIIHASELHRPEGKAEIASSISHEIAWAFGH